MARKDDDDQVSVSARISVEQREALGAAAGAHRLSMASVIRAFAFALDDGDERAVSLLADYADRARTDWGGRRDPI